MIGKMIASLLFRVRIANQPSDPKQLEVVVEPRWPFYQMALCLLTIANAFPRAINAAREASRGDN